MRIIKERGGGIGKQLFDYHVLMMRACSLVKCLLKEQKQHCWAFYQQDLIS